MQLPPGNRLFHFRMGVTEERRAGARAGFDPIARGNRARLAPCDALGSIGAALPGSPQSRLWRLRPFSWPRLRFFLLEAAPSSALPPCLSPSSLASLASLLPGTVGGLFLHGILPTGDLGVIPERADPRLRASAHGTCPAALSLPLFFLSGSRPQPRQPRAEWRQRCKPKKCVCVCVRAA